MRRWIDVVALGAFMLQMATPLPAGAANVLERAIGDAQPCRSLKAKVSSFGISVEVGIDKLEWMGPETKKEAHEKLAKFNPKIGYPNKWRDYSKLEVKQGDLVGNLIRAFIHENNFQLGKVGKPIDPEQWGMTPQTINAYYNPVRNEIVFPAAILQKPYFDPARDAAANYGAIGATIGHEISHGFDDQVSQYDGDGNLRDWWTKEDHDKFAAKTKALVAEYSAFEPLPGYHINGELTLGENIADLGGLTVAYYAMEKAIANKPHPKIDGFTPEQRFFLGFANVWCQNVTEAQARQLAQTDPHSPGQFRVVGTITNMEEFQKAFSCKAGQPMVRENACRAW